MNFNSKAYINNSTILCKNKTIFHLYQRGRLQQTLHTTCFFFLFNLNWSKFRVPDSDDAKQTTSSLCVLFREKSAWYWFMVFALLFYVICVQYTK